MFSKIVTNFLMISFPQFIFRNFFNPEKLNIITCIISQTYFVLNAIRILYFSLSHSPGILIESTINNLYFLYAYLFYDICFLLTRSPLELLFLIHHFVALAFLHIIFYMNISTDMLVKYNIFAVIMEGTNPYLNMRFLLKNTRFEMLNNYIIFITYTLFRVIGYPVIYLPMVRTIYQKKIITPQVKNLLYYKFYIIYSLSLFWYGKILNKVRKLNNK